MSDRDKNTALRGLLDEAEMSNTALAAAVVAAGGREGIHLGTSTTTVRRMLDGCRSQWPTPRLVASVLSGRLQREVSVTECGFVDCTPPGEDPIVIGDPEQALPLTTAALRGIESWEARPQCMMQTDLALTHILGRDPEQAAAFGRDAVRTATDVSSTITVERLRALQRQVHPLRSASPHPARRHSEPNRASGYPVDSCSEPNRASRGHRYGLGDDHLLGGHSTPGGGVEGMPATLEIEDGS